MHRQRRAVGVAVAVVLILAGGCGGEDAQRADYCAELQREQARLAEVLAGEDPTALLDNLPLLEDLAADAPEDLTDEWQTFLNALHGLDDALGAAGVEPDAFRDGQPPEGLSAAELKAIGDAADAIASREVVAAASGIEQQARDVCRINLGL